MSVHSSIASLTTGVVPKFDERSQQADTARLASITTAAVMGIGLAHQVSQPLSAVATYVHAARRLLTTRPVDQELLGEALEKAEFELKRTRDVMEHLRYFVSGGRAERLPVNLLEVTNAAARLLQHEAETRDVRLEIESVSLPALLADYIQIKQVLINLIKNAIDAAAETSDGMVSVRCFHDGSAIEIEVADNGNGIASEIAEHVFEPFQTTKRHGMGVGLPLSRQIIAAHGGKIWWERAVPQGTRFHLRLPFDGFNNEV